MSLAVTIDTHDLKVVGRRMIASTKRAEELVAGTMPALAENVGIIGRDSIRDVTPVDTGELQANTSHEEDVEGMKATVLIKQSLTVSSQVNTWILSELLIKGHDIVTKARQIVGHVDPNPYPDQAHDPIVAEIHYLLETEARIMVRAYASAL